MSKKKYTDNDSGNATNITGGNISMLNCLGIGDNCCLWMLIIILILCLCKNGCLNGIIDKICGCGCLHITGRRKPLGFRRPDFLVLVKILVKNRRYFIATKPRDFLFQGFRSFLTVREQSAVRRFHSQKGNARALSDAPSLCF